MKDYSKLSRFSVQYQKECFRNLICSYINFFSTGVPWY